jgi:FtsH-binding integral membrane protein
MPLPSQRGPSLGRTQARIVWFAIALAMLGAVIGATVLAGSAPPLTGDVPEIFLAVACAVVVGDLGVGFFVASRIRKNASPEAPPDGIAATQVILGSATALSGALVCSVFFFLTNQGLLLLLVAPCALALLTWFPGDRRWAALRPAGAQAGRGRSPMVRE